MSPSRIPPPVKGRILLSLSFMLLGLALFALAAGMLAALVSASLSVHWPWPSTRRVGAAMIFALGQGIAYCLPAFAALLAVLCFRDGPVTWIRPVLRTAGVVLIIGSLCALATLVVSPSSHASWQSFRSGGAVGAFLTAPEGLGASRLLGPAGASLLFGSLFLAGVFLLWRYLVRDLFASAAAMRRACAASKAGLFRRLGWGAPPAVGAPFGAAAIARDTLSPPTGLSLWDWVIEGPLRLFARIFLPGRHRRVFTGMSTPEPQGPRIIDRSGTDVRAPGNPGAGPIFDLAQDTAFPPSIHRTRRTNPGRGGFDGSQRDRRPGPVQQELDLFPPEYKVPPMSLLNPPAKSRVVISHEEILQTSARLEQTLAEFAVEARVDQVVQGPVITRFELLPAAGVKVSRISGLEREIAMALLAEHVRIQAPIPGKATVGVEVPNKKTNSVYLREILMCEQFQSHPSSLAFGLGKDITGEPIICDLADMPHLLIAGATGSGKSVCLNSIIVSFLMRMPPEQVKFIMVDPKRVELTNYQDIPHLLAPVVVDPRKAAGALSWVVRRMEDRYRELEQLHVRNIAAYNTIVLDALDSGKALRQGDLKPMPYIVVVVDELADLMVVARSEVEESIQRLSQMSRAVGIHLILATQRPSVNVITGVIKANLPARVAFRVSSKVDSRTILDCNGAEALVGRGDMLYSPGGGRLHRVQGAFLSDVEVERVADMLREQGPPRYEQEDFVAARLSKNGQGAEPDESHESDGGDAEDNELYLRALQLVLESRQASVSLIQRRLKIGYARAGRLMDLMQEAGIVGPYQGSKPRELLVDPEEHLIQLEQEGLIVRDGFHGGEQG